MKKPTAPKAELIAAGKLPPHYGVGKSDGDEAVQAWIALLPDWQSERAREIDAIITETRPEVAKAIRYNGAWYGQPAGSFFLAINSLKRHLKLTFFDGQSMTPPLPIALKAAPAGALDLRQSDRLDHDRIATWVRQATTLPGYGKAPG